jgi:hypothetical protein
MRVQWARKVEKERGAGFGNFGKTTHRRLLNCCDTSTFITSSVSRPIASSQYR